MNQMRWDTMLVSILVYNFSEQGIIGCGLQHTGVPGTSTRILLARSSGRNVENIRRGEFY